MSEEMKVRYGDVEDAISKIESASEAFETSLMKEMASGNELDVVNKLNELNGMLEEIGMAYKNVLKENNQSVIKILQEIKEVDHNISSSIKVR
ncbi:DUF5344 family protein [Peribacillus simplex]|uniref:DUF5344 family protein n=1 Tax=Peribacillus simplex TaxID=1478 RepID=UPI0011DC8A92|nr:DUF5344 family protein [Peribacillus simplex]